LPIMVAVAIACLPVFFTGHRIDRWEGALFLGFYAIYVVVLLGEGVVHPDWIDPRVASLLLAAALVVLTLGILLWRACSSARPR